METSKQVRTRSSGRIADVSILKTTRQRRLQMLLTSLTSRTDQYFAFLFGIASLQINIWSICNAREFLCALHYVFANNYMNVDLLFWRAINIKFGHAKFCKIAMTKCRKFYGRDTPFPLTPPSPRLRGLDFEPPPLQISGYATDCVDVLFSESRSILQRHCCFSILPRVRWRQIWEMSRNTTPLARHWNRGERRLGCIQWSNYEGARGGLAPLKDRAAPSKHLVWEGTRGPLKSPLKSNSIHDCNISISF